MWINQEDGVSVREVHSADPIDVGPVIFPAYALTQQTG